MVERYRARVPDEGERGLRAEQVAQTRAALVDAARRHFGEDGYAATSVNAVAATARVTIGALYHHFPTKTALFEAVFEQLHGEMLMAAERRALRATDPVAALKGAIDDFLDTMLDPTFQRIMIVDGPAVLGAERFTELDEKDAFGPFVEGLRAAGLRTGDPETLARMIFGMLTRAGMLISTAAQPRRARNRASKVLGEIVDALCPTP